MAEIQPFRAVMYNAGQVHIGEVLTQPYDKITPQMQARYLKRSPHNLVRIELGEELPGDDETRNKYTRARDLYRAWLREGVLRRAEAPAVYALEQQFICPHDGSARIRRALIGRVRLHRWEEGRILPHEQTLSKPKADRLALLRACGTQQGQIFMLYPQRAPRVKPGRLLFEVTDEYEVTNRLWEITDTAAIAAICSALAPQTLYIADGHHRYETALAFRDECRDAAGRTDPDAPWEFVMATLVDMNDPGLVILPTHRVVSNLAGLDLRLFEEKLAERFVIERHASFETMLEAVRAGPRVIGMADERLCSTLRLHDPAGLRPLFESKPPLWHRLDVALLHVAILEALLGIDETRLREETNVSYWREPAAALREVREGRAQLAFFLGPTRVSDVQAIAEARSRMPQKSTDFFPKLLSGLLMYEAREEPET
jgi:uncharacterized protein (DUF1015 family)